MAPEPTTKVMIGDTSQNLDQDAVQKLEQRTVILIGVLLLAGFVPAAYLGALAIEVIARTTNEAVSGVVIVGIGGALLAALGATAYGVATKWPERFPLVVGTGSVILAGLSLWMLVARETAREGAVAFVISAVVLALMIGFVKLMEST